MGAGALGASALVAGPFTRLDRGAVAGDPDHFVPADKKLDPDWVRALTARGTPEEFRGDALRTIGMPAGGIGAGQVYLTGDGRLDGWDVANRHANSGYGRTNYRAGRQPDERIVGGGRTVPAPAVRQGCALEVGVGDDTRVLRLDAGDCDVVRFRGSHPLARVRYAAKDLPLDIELEAGAPCVPLRADDSALPVTLLCWTLRNTGERPLELTLASWLDNFSCLHSGAESLVGRIARRNRCVAGDDLAGVHGTGRLVEPEGPETPRAPLLFADFEGEDYGNWQVEGEAFGSEPARGTLPRQQDVSGFEGDGLVNTYRGGDETQGRLISPTFRIERPYVSFLIGGGADPETTCLELVLADGSVARRATGRNDERLERQLWDVRDLQGREARLRIVDTATGPWGHVNVDHIEFRDTPPDPGIDDLRALEDHGSLCLAVVDAGGGEPLTSHAFDTEDLSAGIASLRPAVDAAAAEPHDTTARTWPTAGVGLRASLAPGETRRVTFAVAWHFPNLHTRGRYVGRRYAQRFRDALAVARYVARERDRLLGETRRWRDTWYDSTLPHWLLDRLHSTVANLATNTCQWWRNGRFWAWEGVGCCAGTCGHVWNYAQGLARLFPALERSVREMQDFAPGVGFDPETGRIGFRGEGWPHWAADAQCGYVLKAWREHLNSADDAFLARLWTRVRRALEFLIEQDTGGDEDPADGVLEGRQHNTYDIDYYGMNPLSGWLYVAALRAGEAMAGVVGDRPFALRCAELAATGRDRLVERSFEPQLGYFVQRVDLAEHPEWQVGDGCLADQLFGQSWARQVGLDGVAPREHEDAALEAIWRHCWAPDVGPQNRAHAPERWFARPGEAGLFTCTWPHSAHLGPRSTRYRNEVWTGIEYQVASNLAWTGRITEALAICRAVHERYHPQKRNPFNEVECGDHYARALASWGVLIGLSGFTHDGPAGRLGFAPRLTPGDFRCAFTAAEGWGSYAQQRAAGEQRARIELRHGRLRLSELSLELAPGARAGSDVEVTVDGTPVAAGLEQQGDAVQLRLQRIAELNAPATVAVRVPVVA